MKMNRWSKQNWSMTYFNSLWRAESTSEKKWIQWVTCYLELNDAFWYNPPDLIYIIVNVNLHLSKTRVTFHRLNIKQILFNVR